MSRVISIGVDSDDVIFDYRKYQLEKGKRWFRLISVFYKKKQKINLEAYSFKEMFQCSQFMDRLFWLFHIRDYALHAEIKNGAKESIQEWRSNGYKVYNITARYGVTYNNLWGTINRYWSDRRFKKEGIIFDGTDFCSERLSARDKVIAAYKRRLDYFLEDKKENLEALRKIPDLCTLQFVNVCNERYFNEDVIRVIDFTDASKIIKIREENYQREQRSLQKKAIDRAEHQKLKILNQGIDKEVISKHEKNYKIFYHTIVKSFRYIYKINIIHEEKIPYQKGGIFIANHLHYNDQFIFLNALKSRPTHFVIAKELLENRLKRFVFGKTGVIAFDRKDEVDRFKTLNEMIKMTAYDKELVVFVEGGRNKEKSDLLRAFDEKNAGIILTSMITGVPIYPLSVNENYGKLRNDFYVVIGDPVIVSPDVNPVHAFYELYYGVLYRLVEENKKYEQIEEYRCVNTRQNENIRFITKKSSDQFAEEYIHMGKSLHSMMRKQG
jgi:1-acyl-sn-glycerol-3-phosphate acyltransferase